MRRDVDRTELPGGSAYNMVDFIPDEVQAVTGGRGGWTYAGAALSGATQIKGLGILPGGWYSGTYANGGVIAIDQQPKAWDPIAGTSFTGTPTIPGGPPAFHRGYLILPNNNGTSAVTAFNSTAVVALGASAPTAQLTGVYKDHALLANTAANPVRLWFSSAGDPTVWDTTFGYWDTTGTISAIATTLNSILVFHPDHTERLRGTSPPPGSDMALEPLFDDGCIDPFSVANWKQWVVFASSRGIYLTDGTSVVDLTATAEMKTYWSSLMSGYAKTWRIAAGVYRDHYIISINNGSTLIDCLCVNLNDRTMWRFSNLHGSSLGSLTSSTQEKLYMGQWNTGRVAELSTLWSPSSAVKQDGDGTKPTPIVETGMYRGFDRLHRRWIESMGKQKWRWSYVDYDLRDAATDNPTATLSYCKTPTGTYTQAGLALPETTDVSRVRRSLSPTQGGATHSQMLGLKLAVNGPYASAKLLTLEGVFEPIEIGAL